MTVSRKIPLEKTLNDTYTAKQLTKHYGAEIRFVADAGQWLRWDGSRWKAIFDSELRQLAIQTVKRMESEALDEPHQNDSDKLLSHSQRAGNGPRLNAAMKLAEADPKLRINTSDLDPFPTLLNCVDGTADLASGQLSPPDPHQCLTKCAATTPDSSVQSHEWREFVHACCGGDAAYAAFLQKCVGAAVLGDNRHERMFIAFGPTQTGKSTFLEAIRSALGDFAATADIQSFLSMERSGPNNDLARLQGVRLVVTGEAPSGGYFDEARLKLITGRDQITARFLRKEFFEFTPQFTLFIGTNFLPRLRGGDDAVWRRIVALPFSNQVADSDRDDSLKNRFINSKSGKVAVLTWCIEGAERVLADEKLEPFPAVVSNALREYKTESDPFGQFLEDRCFVAPGEWARSSELRRSYETWCHREGHASPLGDRSVAERLKSLGCTRQKRSGSRGWQGIGLRAGAVSQCAVDLPDPLDSSTKPLKKNETNREGFRYGSSASVPSSEPGVS